MSDPGSSDAAMSAPNVNDDRRVMVSLRGVRREKWVV